MPKRIENWSLTSLQQRLVKTGGRLVKHARYYRLMLAESHLQDTKALEFRYSISQRRVPQSARP
ncbi:MAG: hypothetical protein ACLQPN_11435 [Bryobacteraceae bacterium]